MKKEGVKFSMVGFCKRSSFPHVYRRWLCISKRTFTRVSKKKHKGNNNALDMYMYCHTEKDIQHLLQEFSDMQICRRKLTKALALAKERNQHAEHLERRRPAYERLIKQRYPKFIHALRDLGDCLTIIHLIARFSVLENGRFDVKQIYNCRRLCHDWQDFITRTHSLRKTFISGEGIYYQAEVEGQKITWLAPHVQLQMMTDDIDFNLTFLEFNETLLGSVCCKLYHSILVPYPPILDFQLEALAAELHEFTGFSDNSEIRENEDTIECKALFKNMIFYLSREIPKESLQFIIPAFGGIVSWEGGGCLMELTSEQFTHQIVQIPTQGHICLSREYVQPQWVYDCVNARTILPTEGYKVWRVPPPHLSPFVDNDGQSYVPDYAETINRLQAASKKQKLPMLRMESEGSDVRDNILAKQILDRIKAQEVAEKKQKAVRLVMLEKQYHNEMEREHCCREVRHVRTRFTYPPVRWLQDNNLLPKSMLLTATRKMRGTKTGQKTRFKLARIRRQGNAGVLQERKRKEAETKGLS